MEINDRVTVGSWPHGGCIIEIRCGDDGRTLVYKVQHADGFENWYTERELAKVDEIKVTYQNRQTKE